jgi:thiamine biosynthesis protein ThiS
MLMIRLNGEEVAIEPGTVTDLLKRKGYRIERAVVELNTLLLSREAWSRTELKSGDCLEVVGFVGGG